MRLFQCSGILYADEQPIPFTSTPSCEPETGGVKEEADDGAVGEVRTETALTDWADARCV